MSSVLVVEEMTGRRRKVTLKGAGLPFQGASWTGTMNVVTQWNPGNPEATQHVLSPQELPSAWEGEWNTNRLVSAPCTFSEAGEAEQTISFANTLVEIFDSIRRGGQLLRVVWAEQRTISTAEGGVAVNREFKISRIGRLTEFRIDPARMDDIPWSMTFDWAGRGENQRKTTDLTGDSIIAASRRAIAAQTEVASFYQSLSLLRGRDGVKNATSAFRLGDLEAIADGPRQLVDDFSQTVNSLTNRMKGLGDLILKVRETPAAIAGQAVDVATNAVSVANQFVDAISRESPEAWSTRNKVSNLTRAASYFGEGQTQAEYMSRANDRFARTARRRANAQSPVASRTSPSNQSDILAVHVPRQGETLHSISLRYYEADLSSELARANGLPAYTITPPTRVPLVIPTRTALEAQQASNV